MLSRLSQDTRQSSQHITDADAVCASSFLNLAVAFLQSLRCCSKHAVCDAFRCFAVLLDLVYAVCEEVDVGFERLAEFAEVRLQSGGRCKCECKGCGRWLLFG